MALLPSPTTFPTLRLYTSPSISTIVQTSSIFITSNLKSLFLTTSPLATAPAEALLHYHLVSQAPLQTGLLLEMTEEDGSKSYLTQTIAILEYMEELGASIKSLLPPATELVQRARVKELLSILASSSSFSLQMDVPITSEVSLARNHEYNQNMAKIEIENKILACESLIFNEYETTLAHALLVPLTKHAISHHGIDIPADPRFKKLWPIFRGYMGMWEFRDGCQAGERAQRDDDEDPFTLDVDTETSSEEDCDEGDDRDRYEGTLLDFST